MLAPNTDRYNVWFDQPLSEDGEVKKYFADDERQSQFDQLVVQVESAFAANLPEELKTQIRAMLKPANGRNSQRLIQSMLEVIGSGTANLAQPLTISPTRWTRPCGGCVEPPVSASAMITRTGPG